MGGEDETSSRRRKWVGGEEEGGGGDAPDAVHGNEHEVEEGVDLGVRPENNLEDPKESRHNAKVGKVGTKEVCPHQSNQIWYREG